MRPTPILRDLADALEADLSADRQPDIASFRSGLDQAGPLNDLDEPSLLLLHRLWPLAMRSGPEFLRALLEASPPLEGAPGPGRFTPLGHALSHAKRHESSEACSLLLQAGANPNSPRLPDGEPCLAHALVASLPWLADLFIQAGVDLSWSHPVTGASYLHYAIGHNHPEVVAALLARGVDPRARAINGRAPLDVAKALQHDQCARIIASFLEAQELRSELLPAAAASPRSIAL